MAFAPPAQRGDFLFSSVIYADPGNNNRHPRASVAELAGLLRPEAPSLYSKGHKPATSSPAKDPPWHFYSAQLIHYGLPVTKDKNGAKVRLLTAMNQFKLEVPAWILKLEIELKNEWVADNRKMKRAGGIGANTPEKASKAKGRAKASNSASNSVNVTVNVSLPSGLSIAEQPASSPKKPASKRKRKESNASPSAIQVEKPSTPTKRVKKEPVANKSTPRVKTEKTTSPYGTSSPARPKQEYDSSQPQVGRNPNSSTGRDRPTVVSGAYSITCDTATDMFQEYDFDLTLAQDHARNAWWATFRWGAWDGIMQMRPGPTGLNHQCSLSWRLRDLETGRLTFGKSCMGDIMFFGDGTLTGSLYGVPGAGTVDFKGTRLSGPSVQDDLQHEWDAFVSEAYGR